MSNILQITPYPIKKCIHGGQLRCKYIHDALVSAGNMVVTSAIYIAEHYSKHGKYDYPVQQSQLDGEEYIEEISDYLLGQYAAKNGKIKEHINYLLNKYPFDYVFLEHPWCYSLIDQLELPARCKIIYSSHNIEWKLKKGILEKYGESDLAARFIVEIKDLEQKAIVGSDFCIVCTRSDADEFGLLKSKDKVILAPNAGAPFQCSEKRAVDWYWHFGKKPYAVFVGSAHVPNVSGFWNMMNPGLTFLAPDQKIVVLGGVGQLLFSYPLAKEFEQLNRDRVILTGYVEKSELDAIILGSAVVILPITEGQGSNLKTAEALLSGKKIIATTTAFRGYEFAKSYPNVKIIDDSDKFRSELKETLDEAAASEPVFHPPEPLENLTWDGCLKGVVKLVGMSV